MGRRRETRRLARAFQCALLAAGCPGLVVACGTSSPTATSRGVDAGAASVHDAAIDAADATDSRAPSSKDAAPEATADATSSVDAAADATPKTPFDAGSGGCFGGSFELDGGPDADPDADTCEYVYGCDINGGGLTAVGCQIFLIGPDGGPLPFGNMTCFAMQDAGCDDDALAPNGAGGMNILCSPCPGGGRRTAGVRAPKTRAPRSVLGAYLARMAFEESASIAAFERLGAELGALGAPVGLVAAAARAARDEVRHAGTMSTLATARGARIAKAHVRRARPRSAAAVAAENAAEGCVRETYGALLARWQATHAADATLRRALARIADDEAAHAALSWEVARWLEPKLSARDRARVARARAKALADLRDSVTIDPHDTLVRTAGLPRAASARTLLDAMATELGLDAA